ncbi:MAG: glycosyltransferase [Deltaproteobacteria bacterium]|nr:glycosyltransferase [Deltaproteobacteria bacterium]
MRILHIVQGFPPEFFAGTELYCQALAHALHERGHECFVFAGSHQYAQHPALLVTEEAGIGVARYVTPFPPQWQERQIEQYDPHAEQLFRRHLETIRPDVVHLQHWHLLTTTLVSQTTAAGIPVVATLHDLWTTCARMHRQHRQGHFCQEPPSPSLCAACVERQPWQGEAEVRQDLAFRQQQLAAELQQAHVLIVPSESHRQALQRFLALPGDRLRVVPHGSLARLAPRTEYPSSRFPQRRLRLAHWGHLTPHKGVHVLLEALRLLPDPAAVEMILLGQASDPEYSARLQTLAAGLSVTFAGGYQVTDLSRLNADLAVFPSLAWETYSFVLDEALQLGLPVIVSDRGALAARAGEAGLVFAGGDALVLAQRIQDVLDSPTLLDELKRHIAAVPLVSMAEHARVIEGIYKEAQEARQQAPLNFTETGVPTTQRLAAFHVSLAAREQEILTLQTSQQQQLATLAQREAVIAQQDTTLRQQAETLQQQSEQLGQQTETLRQQETRLHQQEEAARRRAEKLHHNETVRLQLQERLHQQELALQRQDRQFQQHEQELQQREQEIQQTREQLHALEQEAVHLRTQLQDETAKVRILEDWLQKLFHSLGWRILDRFYYLREHLLAPPGTRRGKIYDRLKRIGTASTVTGLKGLVQETRAQLLAATATREDPYRLWLEQHALTPERTQQLRTAVLALSYRPKVSVIMPVYNPAETWLRRAIESVSSQLYPHWELCLCDDASTAAHVAPILAEYARQDERIRVLTRAHNGGISTASNGALSLATGEFVGLLDHDDELTPDALSEVVALLNAQPDLDFIYSDEDKMSVDGHREEPFFKPDWSPDLLLSMNYITHFSVMRRSLITEVGGFTEGMEGSQDYDLFLRLTEKTQRIGHIAKPLYSWRKVPSSTAGNAQAKPYAHLAGQRALEAHLRRRGIDAEVEDGLIMPFRYRVRYRIHGQPLVSIIIPTKDRLDLLRRCVDSIEKKTAYRQFEIVILDHQSEEPETAAYLASLPHTVVPVSGPFNYSTLNNIGVAHARGEFLLFLNNDTEVISEEWLTAMLEHAQREEVGAVGAKLLYPNDTIQHAGVVLGHGGVAGHAFWYLPAEDGGYFDLPHLIRDYSAVTAACLMMRKSVFAEVGGFDEQLRVAFNDIDLCLRVREKGYRNIYTPYAVLYHLESATRKKLHPMSDERFFRQRWGQLIEAGDPYYSPHLSLERFDFSLRILDRNPSPPRLPAEA